MRLIAAICLFFAALTGSVAFGAPATDPALLKELAELAGRVTEAFPPDRYYYVGWGRSPAGLMKMLEARGAAGRNIPLSKMGYIKSFDETQLRNFLFHHFDRYLPTAADLAGRRLVVIDWANKGGTLINSKRFLDEYQKAKGVGAATEFLALHHEGKTVPFLNLAKDKVEQVPLAAELEKSGIRTMALPPASPLGQAFGGGSVFDAVAEYPSFDVEAAMKEFAAGKPDRPLERRAEYAAFGAEVESYLSGKEGPAPGAAVKPAAADSCARQFQRFRPGGVRAYSP